MKFPNLLQEWQHFWFEKQAPTAIAIYRILFGCFVLETALLEIAPNFSYFFGEKAIINIRQISTYWWGKNPVFDLFLLVPQNDTYLMMVFAIFIIAALCLTLGLFTKLSSIMVYLGLLSLDRQCPFVLDGGDDLMRLASFILCFSNAGAVYSIDSVMFRRIKGDSSETIPLVSPWAQRLLQVQVAIAYFFAFANKIVGPQWQTGTAVYYVTHLDDFIKYPLPFVFDYLLVSKFLTYYTLFIEFALSTFVWFKPLRYWILLGGVILHLGIDTSLSLPGFQWFFIASYILFVDPSDLAMIIERIKESGQKCFSKTYWSFLVSK